MFLRWRFSSTNGSVKALDAVFGPAAYVLQGNLEGSWRNLHVHIVKHEFLDRYRVAKEEEVDL